MTQLPQATAEMYDNTRLSAYKTCPRSFFIRHVLGWRPDGTGIPLVFGLSWHAGQDIVWNNAKKLDKQDLANGAMLKFLETWEAEGLEPNMSLDLQEHYAPRTPMIAHEMYHNYINERWRMLQECDVLAVEQPFAVPLPNMEDVWYIGRLDKVVQYSGQKVVLEHKTTTAYAIQGNFRSDYIDGWYADSQIKGYQYGAGLYYPGLDGVWVDAALVHKKIHNAFRFVPVAHGLPLIVEWLGDTQEWALRVHNDTVTYQAAGELPRGCFPKNENSCYGKFGQCPFLDICRTIPDPSKLSEPPVGFIEDRWEPFSLLGLDKLVKEPEV